MKWRHFALNCRLITMNCRQFKLKCRHFKSFHPQVTYPFTRSRHFFHREPTFLSPKEGMVAPLEATDWRKAGPIRRPRASRFALFGCFRMPEVLLFALFPRKAILGTLIFGIGDSRKIAAADPKGQNLLPPWHISTAKKEPGDPDWNPGSVRNSV